MRLDGPAILVIGAGAAGLAAARTRDAAGYTPGPVLVPVRVGSLKQSMTTLRTMLFSPRHTTTAYD